MWGVRINTSLETYIKNTQEKAKSGKESCKMRELIKHNMDIVTVSNITTSLVFVVNNSYYHCVFNEGTGIVADDFLFFQMACCRENIVVHRDWFGVIVNIFPHLDFLMFAKPI